MWTLRYILQSKVDKLICDMKGVKTNINDIIFLRKDWFTKNKEELRIIFDKLRAVGLKVNAPKCIFGLKEIPCLGNLITREGIKPYLEELQGIMDIRRQPTTSEAWSLIGMMHYYSEMWPRRSHVLALLTESASSREGRNLFCNDAL